MMTKELVPEFVELNTNDMVFVCLLSKSRPQGIKSVFVYKIFIAPLDEFKGKLNQGQSINIELDPLFTIKELLTSAIEKTGVDFFTS